MTLYSWRFRMLCIGDFVTNVDWTDISYFKGFEYYVCDLIHFQFGFFCVFLSFVLYYNKFLKLTLSLSVFVWFGHAFRRVNTGCWVFKFGEKLCFESDIAKEIYLLILFFDEKIIIYDVKEIIFQKTMIWCYCYYYYNFN